MAGSAKPSVVGLGIEAIYTLISAVGCSGQTGVGLFDGTTPNEWNTNRMFDWYNDTDNLIINIKEKCNIWRCGTTTWSTTYNALRIYKLVNGSYVDVTSTIQQSTSATASWEKTISNIDPGTYKFTTNGFHYERIDSEWYLELIGTRSSHLIVKDSKLFSINASNYDSITKSYIQLIKLDANQGMRDFASNNKFELSQLSISNIIGTETFKPIDKIERPFRIMKLV